MSLVNFYMPILCIINCSYVCSLFANILYRQNFLMYGITFSRTLIDRWHNEFLSYIPYSGKVWWIVHDSPPNQISTYNKINNLLADVLTCQTFFHQMLPIRQTFPLYGIGHVFKWSHTTKMLEMSYQETGISCCCDWCCGGWHAVRSILEFSPY